MLKAQSGMAGGKYSPNTYDVNSVKRHDDNSAINNHPMTIRPLTCPPARSLIPREGVVPVARRQEWFLSKSLTFGMIEAFIGNTYIKTNLELQERMQSKDK